MRVLLVSTFAQPDQPGGAERVVSEVAAGLARRGHAVTLLCAEGAEAPGRVHYPVDRGSPAAFWRSVWAGVRARLPALAAGADVLLLHQIASAAAALAPGSAARRLPCVLTFHAPYALEYLARRRAGRAEGGVPAGAAVAARLLRAVDRYVVQRADRILVLSRFAQQQVITLAPRAGARVRVAPAGVDLERFRPRATAATGGEPVILSVRRLVPRMGLSDLVEACALLAGRGVRFRLVLAGEGEERAALQAQVERAGLAARTSFPGRVPEEELPALYRAADVFALPSRALEGFGMATAEALASGLPVVATDVGGTRELLGEGSGALLVPPEDPPALADALAARLADPAAARAARLHAERHLSWEGHLRAVEEEAAAASAARGAS